MAKNQLKLAVITLMGLGLFIGITQVRAQTQAAPAQQQGGNRGQWKKNHPRRAQVNKRLNRQNRQVRNAVKNGKMTPQQAQQIHQEDQSIRQQERQDASTQGGHITKEQQQQFNQQENQVHQQIKQDESGGGAAPAAPAAGGPAAAPAQ